MTPAPHTPTLFPIFPTTPGLARLAAEARHAADGHLIEFRTLEVRSILNRSTSPRWTALAYSINPYRGCEFACRYCYARYTHSFLAPKPASAQRDGAVGTVPGPASAPEQHPAADAGVLLSASSTSDIWPDPAARRASNLSLVPPPLPDMNDPAAFERVIFLKQNAAWLLEQELRGIDPAGEIVLGTATDPYQPIERSARITRSLLEVFARQSGLKLGIVTKSRLIERDIDLLTRIAERNQLTVHLTITTPDAALARLLEPRAPRPDLRFAAVRKLRDAGIVTGILCSPLLPGITDSPAAIDDMAQRAAAAGASFFSANPLFLKACSRPTYLSFVREHFPALVADHQRRFGSADFASEPYKQHLARIVAAACRKHGIRQRCEDAPGATLLPQAVGGPSASARKPPTRITAPAQNRLFAI